MDLISLTVFILPLFLLNTFSNVGGDGQRDFGEPCSLRSQIANLFRENDSEQGCMTDKGLVCISHQCRCDPTSIYVESLPSSTSDTSSGGIRDTIGNFILKKVTGSGSTTPPPQTDSNSPVGTGGGGGRCVGRSGSPCLTDKSACVEHAICQGSPKICRCQGIYGSGPTGHCSKRATVINEVLKRVTGR